MSIPRLGDHTTGLVDALNEMGVLTGDGRKPDGAGWEDSPGQSPFRAYAIVYPLPATFDGTLARAADDLTGEWQVTSVGPDQATAQAVADTVRSFLLEPARPVVIAGRKVTHVTYSGGPGVTRDDDDPPLFYSPDRYLIHTTPTPDPPTP